MVAIYWYSEVRDTLNQVVFFLLRFLPPSDLGRGFTASVPTGPSRAAFFTLGLLLLVLVCGRAWWRGTTWDLFDDVAFDGKLLGSL
mmetsp:Transcript_9256/g.23775  ORF Transcript_9256/g.23775 Transcript_9256/m.23775 type:complete len:86 (+) Transcript_9256:16-273(+)